MLFDLRGRGRRRTVRVIYIGLALLMGVGLVGFGIGGGFGGGGILNAASSNEGSNSASFANQIKKYRKQTQQNPANAAAWENLTKALLHEAGGVNGNSTTVTSRAKAIYKEASVSWSRYIALKPAKPSAELAQLMATVYGEEGLNEPVQAVAVLQVVVAARPTSASLWAALAESAYKAKNLHIGDLASEKAVSLAPAADRTRVKEELAELAKSGGEKTYTTTTNGKTYVVKKAANGTFTGTAATPTTTAPSTTTTIKK
jgi:hypothetical protein